MARTYSVKYKVTVNGGTPQEREADIEIPGQIRRKPESIRSSCRKILAKKENVSPEAITCVRI